jgi:hypothetical protein
MGQLWCIVSPAYFRMTSHRHSPDYYTSAGTFVSCMRNNSDLAELSLAIAGYQLAGLFQWMAGKFEVSALIRAQSYSNQVVV